MKKPEFNSIPLNQALPSAGDGIAIEVKNASVVYQTADSPVHALSGINLSVAAGEFVSLIGPSGCGKTTLVRVVADLEKISDGSVLVNGVTPDQARLARAYEIGRAHV